MHEHDTPKWVWLFPAAQFLHAAEELLQGYGFHGWLRSFRGAEASARDLVILHAAFIAAFAIAALASARRRWVVPAMAVLVLLNAAAHLVAAMMSSERTSGLFTAVVLWIPLGIVALRYSRRHLSARELVRGCIIGAAVQLPISWLAYTAGG